jgi:hypothetical protein
MCPPNSLSLSLAACLATAALTPAQILPGHSIVTVAVANVGGEMYDVDHTTRIATKLTIPAALVTERPNCVLMLNPVTGFVGTNPTAGTANVYSITVTGTTVTATQLNTTALKGLNCAQIALLGSRLFFCVQDSAGLVGWIQSVPIGGGAVADELDCSTLGALGLANALCAMGGKIYCATFNSSPANSATTPGELIEYDPVLRTGRQVMRLPAGKFDPVNNPWNTGIVNMRPYALQPGVLALLGVYGDLLHIDPATAMVVRHDWTGTKNAGGNALASGSVNAFDWDPVAQDWIVSTRYGTLEVWVHDQQAERKISGVGSSSTPTSNSSTGMQYFPFPSGSDASYGPGCQGTGTWEPTDSSSGAPIAGNAAFRLGLYAAEGGDAVVLLLGLQNTVFGSYQLPLDLAFLGITPSCFLRTDIRVTVPAVTTGTGPGEGQVTIPVPLPAGSQGTKIYRQWAARQSTPTNPAGVVVSNARVLTIQ